VSGEANNNAQQGQERKQSAGGVNNLILARKCCF